MFQLDESQEQATCQNVLQRKNSPNVYKFMLNYVSQLFI